MTRLHHDREPTRGFRGDKPGRMDDLGTEDCPLLHHSSSIQLTNWPSEDLGRWHKRNASRVRLVFCLGIWSISHGVYWSDLPVLAPSLFYLWMYWYNLRLKIATTYSEKITCACCYSLLLLPHLPTLLFISKQVTVVLDASWKEIWCSSWQEGKFSFLVRQQIMSPPAVML